MSNANASSCHIFIYDAGIVKLPFSRQKTTAGLKQMSEQEISLEDIQKLLDWHRKLDGKTPVLALADTETRLHQSLQDYSAYWFRDEQATHPAAVELFVRQLFDSLRMMDASNRNDVLNRMRSEGGYQSTGAGGVSGTNRYHSDRSRVDKSLIRRKR